MSTRLPIPGEDQGQWGDILNDYLLVAHDSTGALNPSTVGSSQLRDSSVTSPKLVDGTVTEAKLSNEVRTKLNTAGGTPTWGGILPTSHLLLSRRHTLTR